MNNNDQRMRPDLLTRKFILPEMELYLCEVNPKGARSNVKASSKVLGGGKFELTVVSGST